MLKNKGLEQRIQQLEDLEEIKKLQATYGYYVDKGWDDKEVFFEKLPTLFTEDATWVSGAMGVNEKGISNIVEMLKEKTAGGEFAMHSFTNPIIDIDGDTATGKYLLWVGISNDGISNLVYQSEDVEYLRTDEGWKISGLLLHFGRMLNA